MKRSLRKRGNKRSNKRRMRGGVNDQPYSSAASYENSILGSENNQYDRVFNQGGPNNSQSYAIMANENSGSLGYAPFQRAGKRRASRRTRKMRK